MNTKLVVETDQVRLARIEPALIAVRRGYNPNTIIHRPLRKPTAYYLLIYSPYNSLDAFVIVSLHVRSEMYHG